MTPYPTHQSAATLLTSRGFHERAGAWHRDPVIDDGRPSVIQKQPDGTFAIVHKDDQPKEKSNATATV